MDSGEFSIGTRMRVFAAAFILFILHRAASTEQNVGDIQCPDGGDCPDGNTCCKQTTGLYGCCTYPNAVCCSNNSCCPQDYTCSVSTCLKNIVCQDGSECPGGNYTCCYVPQSQDWACCPILQAVCCEDGIHCCPNAYTCQLSNHTCTMATTGKTIPLFRKQPSLKSSGPKYPILQQKLRRKI